MGFLTGKKALIIGVASNRSIAWGIAESMAKNGCEVAFTYQTDKLKSRVEKCTVVLTYLIINCHSTFINNNQHTSSTNFEKQL